MTTSCVRPSHAAHHLVRAAVTAPSVHSTQPWLFVEEAGGGGVEVHADVTRRLILTDPYGREMVISCGAALFNIRLAMRHLGFSPLVEPFPHPWNPTFLARVGWGAHGRPTRDEERMHAGLGQRHTVRGPLRADPVPASLIDALREQAREEGARLHHVEGREDLRRLAGLVRVAEEVHRTSPGHLAEQARWTRPADRPRPDGVPADVSLSHPDRTPFAGRDYADVTRTRPTPSRRCFSGAGLVAVLSTEHDDRLDWLRAGQALERILLYAAGHKVMAAFHTQPLELPRLRARIRETFTAGECPQMILRLGYAPCVRPVPRRPAADVLMTQASRLTAAPR